MAILSIFSASFCRGEEITGALAAKLNWKQIDGDLIAETAKRFGSATKTISRAMEGPPFVFNKFTHRREKLLAQLKVVLSEMLSDQQILYGYATHLIPANVGHVLRVCLLADPEWRATRILQNDSGVDRNEAIQRVRTEDLKSAQWTRMLRTASPWDKSLYDLIITVNDSGTDGAVQLIEKTLTKPVLAYTESSHLALEDFQIAAKSEMALIGAGHYHAVSCENKTVTVIIDEYIMLLERLESEIVKIVRPLRGVKDVRVKTGPNYRPTTFVANIDLDLPEKVLLVDDEKDFVTTLSERLEMRDIEPAVVYSGEEALNLLQEEAPDVMVLDLRMPGIDGIEVLKRVKAEYPRVAVIILTGHGSEKDRELCMALGAFAYLEKPVDIDELSATMKRAKEFIRSQSQE